jgi:hypothetical protein
MNLERQADLLAAHLLAADRDAAWLAKATGIKYRVLLRYIRGERPIPLTCGPWRRTIVSPDGALRSEPARSVLHLVTKALALTEPQARELALAAGLDVPGVPPIPTESA